MIRVTASTFTVDAAAPDGSQARTITGIAVPYNVAANASGTEVMFLRGSLPVEGKAPKLYMQHDASQAIGLVTERTDDEENMYFAAKVSNTELGSEALILAADGVLDSVSVGVNPTKFTYNEAGVMVVEAADWLELSLVSQPAFAEAVITKVAASIDTNPEDLCNTKAGEENTEPQPPEDLEMSEQNAPEVIEASAPIFATAKRQFDLPTAGEYLAAMHIGGTTFENVAAAARNYMLSKQTALQAAAGDVLTTDTPGLLPVPVLGPVFEDLNYVRPVVAAVGARAMPDGGQSKTWIRPTWTTHTSVGTQSSELGASSATTPVIASNVISKTTLSGQVTLSVQDIDFSSPSALQIILQDLAGQYMLQSDNVAADAITAGASASGSTWTFNSTDPSSLIAALYDAATDILTATNFLPDHVFVSPNVWKLLGQQLDGDKRPVFPYTGASGLMGVNGMGTANVTVANTFNPFGLNLVADRNFATNTMVVARGSAIEFYEQVRGIMSVEVPATLGRTFSYYGYVSTFIADADQVKSIIVSP
jgi:HK97 family phage prohead protease